MVLIFNYLYFQFSIFQFDIYMVLVKIVYFMGGFFIAPIVMFGIGSIFGIALPIKFNLKTSNSINYMSLIFSVFAEEILWRGSLFSLLKYNLALNIFILLMLNYLFVLLHNIKEKSRKQVYELFLYFLLVSIMSWKISIFLAIGLHLGRNYHIINYDLGDEEYVQFNQNNRPSRMGEFTE